MHKSTTCIKCDSWNCNLWNIKHDMFRLYQTFFSALNPKISAYADRNKFEIGICNFNITLNTKQVTKCWKFYDPNLKRIKKDIFKSINLLSNMLAYDVNMCKQEKKRSCFRVYLYIFCFVLFCFFLILFLFLLQVQCWQS